MNILIEPWYLTDCVSQADKMPGRVSTQIYDIKPGHPVVISPMKKCTFITGMDGVVWVTQQGSTIDYILRAGKEYRVGRRGKVVMQAIGGSARVEVMTAK